MAKNNEITIPVNADVIKAKTLEKIAISLERIAAALEKQNDDNNTMLDVYIDRKDIGKTIQGLEFHD